MFEVNTRSIIEGENENLYKFVFLSYGEQIKIRLHVAFAKIMEQKTMWFQLNYTLIGVKNKSSAGLRFLFLFTKVS